MSIGLWASWVSLSCPSCWVVLLTCQNLPTHIPTSGQFGAVAMWGDICKSPFRDEEAKAGETGQLFPASAQDALRPLSGLTCQCPVVQALWEWQVQRGRALTVVTASQICTAILTTAASVSRALSLLSQVAPCGSLL